MKWFGRVWLAPVCNPAEHVTTPIGEPCGYCRAPIEAGSRGFFLPTLQPDGSSTDRPWHKRCLEVALGGAEPHKSARCHLDADHDGPCQEWGSRYVEPVIRIASANLARLEDDPRRLQCIKCRHGYMVLHREFKTFRYQRADHCVRCGQRYHYTDTFINGEIPEAREEDLS